MFETKKQKSESEYFEKVMYHRRKSTNLIKKLTRLKI